MIMKPKLKSLCPSNAATCYASSCGRVTLYLGDCLDVLPSLTGVDALVSDPPYGMRYKPGAFLGTKKGTLKCATGHAQNRFSEKIIGDHQDFDPEHLLKYPVAVICGAHHFSHRMPQSRGWIVWDKKPNDYPKNDFSDVDLIWTTADKPQRIFRWLWAGALRQNGQNTKHLHPTEKPIELMAWAMEYADVPQGGTVLDPYMGSGSTIIAALLTGRKAIGIEMDAGHYATALERIKAELAQGDLFHSQHNSEL